uniref:Uncharacterized protein n=1 Tax=Meloidogyne enterolobii TaxID=390850 RepID=A0A6V7X7B0_MELEN|nr:unnamed protein product [Meloidogyne enterolobii]
MDLCKEISIVERNLFIFWNVLAFTRKLIRLFVEHQKEDTTDYYNLILFQRCGKNNENRRNRRNMVIKKISIFQYMQAHDEFEIKANKIKQTKLNYYMRSYRLNRGDIGFYHRNTNYGNT